MEISFDYLLDEYLIYVLYILPIITQVGVPLGITFYIMYYGSMMLSYFDLFIFIITISISFLIGDSIAYYLGKRYGERPLNYISKKINLNGVIVKTKKIVNKNLFFSVLFTRTIFLGGSPILNYLLGIEKLVLKKFLFVIFIGEIIYVSIFSSIGFFLKDLWANVYLLIQDIVSIIGIVILIFILVRYSLKIKIDFN